MCVQVSICVYSSVYVCLCACVYVHVHLFMCVYICAFMPLQSVSGLIWWECGSLGSAFRSAIYLVAENYFFEIIEDMHVNPIAVPLGDIAPKFGSLLNAVIEVKLHEVLVLVANEPRPG